MTQTTPSRRRHPLLAGIAPGVYVPAAVGVVRGYPKTEEAFRARNDVLRANSAAARKAGRLNRRGVPNGWRGRRAAVEAAREEARASALALAPALLHNSTEPEERLDQPTLAQLYADPSLAVTDAQKAAVATLVLLEIAMDKTIRLRERVRALTTILPYLKPLPRGSLPATVEEGLGVLAELAQG